MAGGERRLVHGYKGLSRGVDCEILSTHGWTKPNEEIFLNRVTFKRAAYDEPGLRDKVFALLTAVAGDRIGPGARVLIKPNLLTASRPEQAVLTHPLIARYTAEWVMDCGALPSLGDSPATGGFARVLKTGGYSAAFDGLTVPMAEFKISEAVDIGPPFGRIDLAADALRADAVINLAKLKTHSQMLLTLGVKNLFGCVVGMKKPQWHLRSGVDRDQFARLLVQIHYTIRPVLTLVDGILALEGQGPGKGGHPKHLGILVAGSDAAATDAAVCRMLGVDPQRLPTHRAARQLGAGSGDPQIEGDFFRVREFELPEQGAVLFGPKSIQSFSRRLVLQKPVVDPERCRVCGECRKYCPADAITESGRTVHYDYDRCIRCYCCVEICPHGALRTETPPLGRLLRRLGILD
jgi:uncharacterized protein (DUF362 family)/NAD-dependent dihydropyrimidine dehydrogenase PreA subunit